MAALVTIIEVAREYGVSTVDIGFDVKRYDSIVLDRSSVSPRVIAEEMAFHWYLDNIVWRVFKERSRVIV